jgi:hypothetical protein
MANRLSEILDLATKFLEPCISVLTGQLYLTVLIARLVALEVMSWQPDSKAKSDE